MTATQYRATALERIGASYGRIIDPRGSVDPSALERRAEYFAGGMRFALDRPAAMRRLHRATGELCGLTMAQDLSSAILGTALSLTRADYGNLQLIDPATGALHVVTHYGFGAEFLEYFAVVDDESSVCGRAARSGQTVVPDVTVDPGFTAHRDIAAGARFRGVQSTPLVDYSGHMIGMVSTHFQRPSRPADETLRILQLYGDFAGEALVRSLAPGAAPVDPLADTLLTALLAPAPDSRPQRRATHPEAGAYQDVINRMYVAGLNLAAARALVQDGAADAHIAAALDDLDHSIHRMEGGSLGPARTARNFRANII